MTGTGSAHSPGWEVDGMPPEKHALLGASSADRWLNCPPSARLTENLPDTASPYTAAGTLAHEIAELKARQYFVETLPKRTYNSRLKKLAESEHYDKGMDDATDTYLEHLKARALSYPAPPAVALETLVDFSDIVPEGFGTADCIMVGGTMMDVVDYKNGAGVLVEADNNPQMMLYAWGALNLYRPIFGDAIQTVHMSIVQPNAGGIREAEISVSELVSWSKVVKQFAQKAWEGSGDYCPGDWCRFCKAKVQCSARAAKMLELEPVAGADPLAEADTYYMATREAAIARGQTLPPLLSDAEIGEVLTKARGIASWVADLEEYALKAILAGRTITGFKAVEGRGSRDWAGGTDAAFQALQARGISEAMLYERKPVSVAGLEKSLGKKVFAETADGLWEKKPGKPTLVPASDKREPYNAAAVAFRKEE